MRWFRSVRAGFAALLILTLAGGRTAVLAAEEAYTYTVRLYAGNQGALTGEGIEIRSETAEIVFEKDSLMIRGLSYGDMVFIRPQDAAQASDARYYVRGVRRSGRDNSESEAPAFYVACDRDYVVAYGVSGDKAAYIVNYVDAAGRAIQESEVYYGNIGERQYVSSRYIEGYQPQVLNLVKTLSGNAAEDVFTFVYLPVTAEEENPGAQTGTEEAASGAEEETTEAGQTAGLGGEAAGPGEETSVSGEETTAPGGEEVDIPDANVPLGGDAGIDIPDAEVPLGQQQVVDLDDAEVPLASMKPEREGILMGYFSVYAGVGLAAVIVLAAAAYYLKKKCRPVVSDREKGGGPDSAGK